MRKKSEVLKYLHVMAKQTKEKNDIIGMPCIWGKDGNLKVTSDEKHQSTEGISGRAVESRK